MIIARIKPRILRLVTYLVCLPVCYVLFFFMHLYYFTYCWLSDGWTGEENHF